jgi:hypothetical protein
MVRMLRFLFVLGILAAFSGLAAAQSPTFNDDVAPILYRNCVVCHRPGDIAPFSLLTYENAATRARPIAAATKRRDMPPWKPEANYGDFEGVRRLSEADIAALQAWADAGAPRGEAAPPPAPPKFGDGWRLGTPDLVVKMSEPFVIPPHDHDIYQCFVLRLDLPADEYLSAVEFRPGNRKAVHHSLFFVDTRGVGRWRDGGSQEPGYRCFGGPGVSPIAAVGGWVPGAMPITFPDGTGTRLKKGSDLVIQNHYHPTGHPETDQSSIALYVSKSPAHKTLFGVPVGQPDLLIPAGEKRYRVASSYVTPISLEVVGITPHMHLLGREIKVWATLPDGAVKPMVWIKRWDFNWQGPYRYKQPLQLPKGTRIDVESFYDNSADNPHNPNSPPKIVRWGESTTDEMNVVLIQCQTANPSHEAIALWEVVLQQPAWLRAGLEEGRRP